MTIRLKRSFIPWLIVHSVEFWYYYLGAFTSLAILHFSQSYLPELSKNLADQIFTSSKLNVTIYQLLGLVILIVVFRTLSRLLFFYPARLQQKLLRTELLNMLEISNPKKYEKYTDGDLYQTLMNDMNRVRGFVGFALLQIGNVIIALYLFLPKISAFEPLFLKTLLPLLFAIIIFSLIIVFFQPYMRKDADMMAVLQNYIIESYNAKKTIRNFHAEKKFIEIFQDHSWGELKYFFIGGVGRTFGIPLVKVGFAVSLLWGAMIVKQQGLPQSSLIFYSGFLFLLMEPLMSLSWIGVVTSHGIAGWKRIKELVAALEVELPEFKLEFWGNPIDFEISPKKWTMLAGDTGCGKSYLLDQIALKYKNDNINYSFIQQEPYIYNDTVYSNIFLGNEVKNEDLKKVKLLIKDFGLDVLEKDIDSVLSLEVGENGKKISGGQSKRIALLRSLMSGAKVIIWDDPFSSLDFILEKKIIEKIKNDDYFKDMTFIISSHRLTTLKNSDELYLISKENGIIAKGNSLELLNNKGIVNEYFEKQFV